jgi:hypothetical protein
MMMAMTPKKDPRLYAYSHPFVFFADRMELTADEKEALVLGINALAENEDFIRELAPVLVRTYTIPEDEEEELWVDLAEMPVPDLRRLQDIVANYTGTAVSASTGPQ